MTIDRTLHPRVLGIKDVPDMVKKILFLSSLLSRTKVIKTLNISGHGSEEGMRFGADWVDDKTLPNYEKKLVLLAPYFSREGDSVVTLEGCKVGRNITLLALLSNIFGGVTVRGMTADQYPIVPGEEGEVNVCYYNQCGRNSISNDLIIP